MEGALESSSEEGSSLDEPSWVSWFCMLRNHEFFCEVDPAFVQDRFNLYGLKEVVGPLYGEAMTMILGYAPTGKRNCEMKMWGLEAEIWGRKRRGVSAENVARRRQMMPSGFHLSFCRARSLPVLPACPGAPDVFCAARNIAEKQLSDPSQRIHKVLETARVLYGLIHARYILTAQGLSDMVSTRNDAVMVQASRVSLVEPAPHAE